MGVPSAFIAVVASTSQTRVSGFSFIPTGPGATLLRISKEIEAVPSGLETLRILHDADGQSEKELDPRC